MLLATVWIGICRPLWISAVSLFSVAMRGAESTLISPSLSAAVRRALSWKVLSTLPSVRPRKPLRAPVCRAVPPPTATLFGKTRPVVLPWAASATPAKSHSTPSERLKFFVVSMIRASIMTCGSGMSSDSITASTVSM
ncbi:MAG: hypothetical protein BWY94_02449 [Actinobacteria bacterium ADurb.BinA094]|nr:MAG: hypothetical protein BWY94_02449 [Actinobacteria bacterium ADurb.BinA094]